MSQIAFIGLGIMGRPMTRNLLKAGHQVVVYDIVESAVAELEAAGATRGGLLQRRRREGRRHHHHAARRTRCGGCRPRSRRRPRRRATRLDHRGHEFHQPDGLPKGRRRLRRQRRRVPGCARSAAASPKPSTARWRSWSAASRKSSTRSLPILQKMGSTVTLTGPVGAGNVTKLANQIMVACNIAAMGEALVLATKRRPRSGSGLQRREGRTWRAAPSSMPRPPW